MNSLEGTWQPVQTELNGESAPELMLVRMEVELAEGNYAVRFGGVVADRGTYAVDAEGVILRGVAGPNAGRTIPCILRFEADELLICYGIDGVRPDTFASPAGSTDYFARYRRKA